MSKSATHTELLHTQTNVEETHNSTSSEITEIPKPYQYSNTGYWIRPHNGEWIITYGDTIVCKDLPTSEYAEELIENRDILLLTTTMIVIARKSIELHNNENKQ